MLRALQGRPVGSRLQTAHLGRGCLLSPLSVGLGCSVGERHSPTGEASEMREGWAMSRHWPLPHQVMTRAPHQPHRGPLEQSRAASWPPASSLCLSAAFLLLPGEELQCGFPLTVILPMNVLLGSEGPLLHAVPGPRLQRPSPPSPYSSLLQPALLCPGGREAGFYILFPFSFFLKAKAPGLTPASWRMGREVELCLELKGLEPGKGTCPGTQLRTEMGCGPGLWNQLSGHGRAGGQVLGESGHRWPGEAAWGSRGSLNQSCFLGGEEGAAVSLETDEESTLPAPHQPVPLSEAFIPEPGFQLLPAPPQGGSDHPKARLVAGLTPQGSLPLWPHLPSPPHPPPPDTAWHPCPLASCPGPLLCRPLHPFQAVLMADSCSSFGAQLKCQLLGQLA